MNMLIFFPLIAFFVNIFLGIYVLLIDAHSRKNILYSLFAFSVAAWSFGDFINFIGFYNIIPVVSNLSTIGSIACAATFFHFSFEFTGKTLSFKQIILLYSPAVFLIFFRFFTEYLIKGYEEVSWGYNYVYGELYIFLFLYVFIYIVSGLFLLYLFSIGKRTEKNVKKQIKMIIYGFSIPVFGGTLTQGIFPFMGIDFIPMSSSLITISCVFVAYAIAKYGLLKKMSFSIQKKISFFFIIISIFVITFSVSPGVYFSDQSIREHTYNHLLSVAETKASWVNSYIDEIKRDTRMLSQSPELKNAMNEKTMQDSRYAKEDIKRVAERVTGEVEEYIRNNPNMTLSDLQNSEEFQKIAVQKVGETGYTALTDYNSLVCRFHSSPGIINLDLHTLSGKLPGFWSVMSETEGGKVSQGFYDWAEADGSVKEKYMYIDISDVRTADGVGLSIAATTYVDEYSSNVRMLKSLEDYLLSFKKQYGYMNLFILNPTGDIWWVSGKYEELSEKEAEYVRENVLNELIKMTKESHEVIISYYPEHEHESMKSFFSSTPVYDGDDYLGSIIIGTSLIDINNIMLERIGMGQTGETYILDSNRTIITETINSPEKYMGMVLDNPNVEACAEHVTGETDYNEEITDAYTDYRGVRVLGTYSHIDELKWCVIAEIDESEALSGLFVMYNSVLISVILISITGVLVSIFLSKSITKNIVLLRDIASKIGTGNLEMKVEISSSDEIGELAESFDQMRQSLKKSRRKLEKYAGNLEKDVAERTKELDKKVRESDDVKIAVLNMMEDMDEANRKLVTTQEMLEKSLAELKETDIKKDQFISIAAHELKTPLTSIHGFSQLLQNRKVSDNFAKRNKYLKIMDHETKRLGKLVGDILDLSRIDLGTVKITPVIVDINEFMKNIQREMEFMIKEKKLSSEYDIEKNLPKISTDREKLTEVVINLINNAVKYSQKGKITVKVRKDGKNIHFMIKDNGIGISRENYEKIFDRFYQIDSSYTRSVGGTGLGLSLCKEFVEMMGGKIWVKSEIGKGSEFHFTIPVDGIPEGKIAGRERRAMESIRQAKEVQKSVKKTGLS